MWANNAPVNFAAALTRVALVTALSTAPMLARAADELVLAIQPILSEALTRSAFQPLCDHLTKVTGSPCRIHTSPNFYAYWELVRRGTDYNLALDAAHFTDYRAGRHRFEVLAKVPDTVTYTLITHPDNFYLEAREFTGKRVATLGIPSIGAARLNAMFPNPSRQPVIVEIADAETAMKRVTDKLVEAAIVPTPIVSQHMARGERFQVVLTTDPIPHIALSAAPSLSDAVRQKIRQSLTRAHETPEGKAMLKSIGFERFDAAGDAAYKDQAKILKEYWGY